MIIFVTKEGFMYDANPLNFFAYTYVTTKIQDICLSKISTKSSKCDTSGGDFLIYFGIWRTI